MKQLQARIGELVPEDDEEDTQQLQQQAAPQRTAWQHASAGPGGGAGRPQGGYVQQPHGFHQQPAPHEEQHQRGHWQPPPQYPHQAYQPPQQHTHAGPGFGAGWQQHQHHQHAPPGRTPPYPNAQQQPLAAPPPGSSSMPPMRPQPQHQGHDPQQHPQQPLPYPPPQPDGAAQRYFHHATGSGAAGGAAAAAPRHVAVPYTVTEPDSEEGDAAAAGSGVDGGSQQQQYGADDWNAGNSLQPGSGSQQPWQGQPAAAHAVPAGDGGYPFDVSSQQGPAGDTAAMDDVCALDIMEEEFADVATTSAAGLRGMRSMQHQPPGAGSSWASRQRQQQPRTGTGSGTGRGGSGQGSGLQRQGSDDGGDDGGRFTGGLGSGRLIGDGRPAGGGGGIGGFGAYGGLPPRHPSPAVSGSGSGMSAGSGAGMDAGPWAHHEPQVQQVARAAGGFAGQPAAEAAAARPLVYQETVITRTLQVCVLGLEPMSVAWNLMQLCPNQSPLLGAWLPARALWPCMQASPNTVLRNTVTIKELHRPAGPTPQQPPRGGAQRPAPSGGSSAAGAGRGQAPPGVCSTGGAPTLLRSIPSTVPLICLNLLS